MKGKGLEFAESDLHAPQKQFVPLFFRFHFFAGKAPQACQNKTSYSDRETHNEANRGHEGGRDGKGKAAERNCKGKALHAQ